MSNGVGMYSNNIMYVSKSRTVENIDEIPPMAPIIFSLFDCVLSDKIKIYN